MPNKYFLLMLFFKVSAQAAVGSWEGPGAGVPPESFNVEDHFQPWTFSHSMQGVEKTEEKPLEQKKESIATKKEEDKKS